MTYDIRVPYQKELALGNICARVSSDLPVNSCVFVVETLSAATQVRMLAPTHIFYRDCHSNVKRAQSIDPNQCHAPVCEAAGHGTGTSVCRGQVITL